MLADDPLMFSLSICSGRSNANILYNAVTLCFYYAPSFTRLSILKTFSSIRIHRERTSFLKHVRANILTYIILA